MIHRGPKQGWAATGEIARFCHVLWLIYFQGNIQGGFRFLTVTEWGWAEPGTELASEASGQGEKATKHIIVAFLSRMLCFLGEVPKVGWLPDSLYGFRDDVRQELSGSGQWSTLRSSRKCSWPIAWMAWFIVFKDGAGVQLWEKLGGFEVGAFSTNP